MTTDQFITKYSNKYVDFDLFRWVNLNVFGSSKNNKIFNSVISFNIVNVMYNFFTFKIPINFFLHYQSMFEYISICRKWMIRFINENMTVTNRFTAFPARVFISNHIRSLTLVTTKNSFSAFIINKFFSTVRANIMAFTRFVITETTTKGRFIRGWFIEVFMTLGTIKNHTNIIQNTMRGVNI